MITGSLQQAVLAVLFRADREMTVREIHETLQGKYEPLSSAAIFITLDRMSKKGLIALRKGDPRPERGGKARIGSLITDKGREAVRAARKRDEMLKTLSSSRPRVHKLTRRQDGPKQ